MTLPPFSAIRAEHVQPAIEQILADNRAAIIEILKTQGKQPTWAGLVLAMDELNDRLGAALEPGQPPECRVQQRRVREAYESCLPALSAYSTELGQNRELFEAFEALASSPEAAGFDVAQKTILEHSLRDFRLSGIDLPKPSNSVTPKCKANCQSWAAASPTSCSMRPKPGPSTLPTKRPLAGLTDSAKAQWPPLPRPRGWKAS